MNDWTPLKGPLTGLDAIKTAIRYSIQPDEPGVMLLPYLVSKYPLDSISWWVSECYDPMSKKQTVALTTLLDSKFWRNMPWAVSTDEKIKILFSNIHQRIRNGY